MTSSNQLTTERFTAFIDAERKHYDDSANNSVAMALGILKRKYSKLELLRNRTEPLIALHLSEPMYNVHLLPLDAQLQSLENKANLLLEIEMNFESFFVFGSILCDEIAHMILHFYGSSRGVKLGGHRELARNFNSYAQSLSLNVFPGLQELAEFLERELCDYRDKQIVHDFHPRKFNSISFTTPDNQVRLSYGLMYPKDTDMFVKSKTWSELAASLGTYVSQVLTLVQNNRERSRFKQALRSG